MNFLPPTTINLDSAFQRDIARHGELWKQWDDIARANEDDPRISAISQETADLAKRIVVTPVHTSQARDAKMAVIEIESLRSWDDLGLIDEILTLDATRISQCELGIKSAPYVAEESIHHEIQVF